jgi:hypothetical protein
MNPFDAYRLYNLFWAHSEVITDYHRWCSNNLAFELVRRSNLRLEFDYLVIHKLIIPTYNGNGYNLSRLTHN